MQNDPESLKRVTATAVASGNDEEDDSRRER